MSLSADGRVDGIPDNVAIRRMLAKLPASPAALVLDFDGVLTDNRVWVSEQGVESVACDRGDGLGLELVRARLGLPVVVMSRERNKVVSVRCRKLGVECYQSIDNKLMALQKWTQQRGISLARVIYVGNDINDEQCLQAVGCAVIVADAHPSVRSDADLVLNKRGGRGAVRELCDLLLLRATADPRRPR